MEKKRIILWKNPLFWFLIGGSFLVGLFNEPAGALCSAVLTVLLLVKMTKSGKLKIPVSPESVTVLLVSLGFLATAFWGVDKYYSLLGFVKFLPLIPFWLLLGYTEKEERAAIRLFVPLSGAVMTAVSAVMTWLKIGTEWFSVSGRIGGFFQYPNTFALFLIAGIIILSAQEQFRLWHAALDLVLVFGVFLTGSRTSFVVLAIAVVGLLFTVQNKRAKWLVLGGFAAAAAAGAVYFAVTGKHGAIGRFLAISADSGTLLGRVLYAKDALRVIVKHPFGMGYMGYYFAQGSFQHGVYANQFVHNEALQLLLDIGWIPFLLFAVCAVRALLNKTLDKSARLVIFVLLAHAMLDFDFQFLIMAFLLMLCAYDETNFKEIPLSKAVTAAIAGGMSLVCVLCIWLSGSQALYLLSKPQAAVKWNKYHTMAQMELLQQTDALYQKKDSAEAILKNDQYISNAYSALAQIAYADGDIAETIKYKKQAIKYARYYTPEYTDYCTMLLNVIAHYAEQGDTDSAVYCIKALKALQQTVDDVNDSTDPLAYRLTDQPDLALPEEYREAIDYYIQAIA